MASTLLSPEFLAKIEQLELVSRKVLAGRMKGERRSKRRGFSTEFADHRGYVAGDDTRFIDWNILIRLDRLFIKLFEEEEDLHFHVLLDASRSMEFGDPSKLDYAKRIAAALGAIALTNLDRVQVSAFSDTMGRPAPALRGRRNILRLFDQLDSISTSAGSDLTRACKSFSIAHPSRGIVVLLSDLMDKQGVDAGLRYLIARQFDVYVIHILSAEEVDPPVVGDLKLVDAEDGDVAEVTVSAPLLARYKKTLDSYVASIKDFCNRRGITYIFTTNQQPFEQLVLKVMRQRGLVR